MISAATVAHWRAEERQARADGDDSTAEIYASSIAAAERAFPEVRRTRLRDVWPPGGIREKVSE
jgi:hypothetical protein